MTTLSNACGARHATMGDVAREADVSIKTVSRVVNDEPGVRSGTAQRVLTAIDRLGFRRNPSARNLRRGASTGTLGLVLEDVANPFYSVLTRAVEEVAREHERRVITGSSDEDPDREREVTLELCARRVDGLLLVPAGEQHGYLREEMHSGTPVVFADRPPGEDIAADTVLVDNAGGVREAVHHLHQHGHRRIAFLGDAPGIFTAAERRRGFREACDELGLPENRALIRMGPHGPTTIRERLHWLLDGDDSPTALVTGNNRITVTALRALAERVDRPALVGFDDFELADLLDPPVTVIAHDTIAFGRTAAELLFARLDGDTAPARRTVLPTRLLPRGSGEVHP